MYVTLHNKPTSVVLCVTPTYCVYSIFIVTLPVLLLVFFTQPVLLSSQQNVGSPQANICCVVCHPNILCLLYFYCYSTCPVACFLYSTCPIVCDSSQQNVGSPQANICCVVCHYCVYSIFIVTLPVLLLVFFTQPVL